ncbi:MAG: response regulator transcription factor [Abditibacteriota bacterium]|nr:response regulator transcription factor [Abditibacteriota bacterium]
MTQKEEKTILIADSDREYAKSLENYLEKNGFAVKKISDVREFQKIAKSDKTAFIILDPSFSDETSTEFYKNIRTVTSAPLMILTEKDDEIEKIIALELAADDYVIKPCSEREIAARIRAITRRLSSSGVNISGDVITIGGMSVNRISRTVTIAEEKISLTPKEFELLWALAGNKDKVFTRTELLEAAWSYKNYYGDERTVDQHIKRLRRKIEIPGSSGRIATIWGVGYKFDVNE